MVSISVGSRLPTIQKMLPWMKSQVLFHEIGLCQEIIAGRIGGNGGGSAAESPCDETAIFQNFACFFEVRVGLSSGPQQRVVEHRRKGKPKTSAHGLFRRGLTPRPFESIPAFCCISPEYPCTPGTRFAN